MSVATTGYRLHVEFTTPILGSQPTQQIATDFIAAKAGIELPEDEAETLPEALERGTTVFHKKDGKPVLWDYQIQGFLREAGSVLNGKVTGKIKNLRSKVAHFVFVFPRQIELHIPDIPDREEYKERSLRAKTAQGDRVALARSEMLPEGTSFDCMIEVIESEISEEVLRDLLDHGYYCGLGQWRSGNWGRFIYTLTPDAPKKEKKHE